MSLSSPSPVPSPQTNPLTPLPPDLKRVEGIEKLSRQIEKEIKSPNVNEKSSNLPHLLSILKVVRTLKDKEGALPSAVLKPFPFSSFTKGKGRLLVDIVSNDCSSWFKVSARNPKALNLLAAGGGGFGQKTIIDHVQDYLDCAKENLFLFKPPKINVVFTSGISLSLAEELECLGAFVLGERIPDADLGIHPRIRVSYEDSQKDPNSDPSNDPEGHLRVLGLKNPSLEGVTKLNLDITAFLAYISNLTHGHSKVNFTSKVLADQAKAEGERPQRPLLEKVFEGRELYCCETAFREFQSILFTVGGPEERERATKFLPRVTIVPDQVSPRVQALPVSGSIKERSLLIFGTGDAIEAVTVTANTGFVRSAKTQGVDLAAFIHESRALTEQKENIVLQKESDKKL